MPSRMVTLEPSPPDTGRSPLTSICAPCEERVCSFARHCVGRRGIPLIVHALDNQLVGLTDGDLIVKFERDPERVEPRPKIACRGRHANGNGRFPHRAGNTALANMTSQSSAEARTCDYFRRSLDQVPPHPSPQTTAGPAFAATPTPSRGSRTRLPPRGEACFSAISSPLGGSRVREAPLTFAAED